jgi:hypothetical protein
MSLYLKNLVDSMPRRLQDIIRRERATLLKEMYIQ